MEQQTHKVQNSTMRVLVLVLTLIITQISVGQKFQQEFVTDDITNFWNAFQKITSTKDSSHQYQFIRDYYINKATEGLKSLIEVRQYTEKEYIEVINKYPRFWGSIKANTLSVEDLKPEIEADILKLKQAYPNLKPSTIYFTVGAFRTNGTIQDKKVLIGSEMALADSLTVVDELPTRLQSFYQQYHPRQNLAFLCTHEYIHTQQRGMVENLLSMCLYEGVAEFVARLVTGKKPASPAIEFGKSNRDQVVKQFVADLFIMSNNYNWLWGENKNDFKVRDLGYYIGYEICERYYNSSKDKAKAIKDLIELDYTNEKQVESIVNSTKLLPKTLAQLNKDYEEQRPKVISLHPFKNGSKTVKPGVTKITVTFSKPLNGYNTGIDFGPLGEEAMPKVSRERIWTQDAKSWTFEADLKPNIHYQILISNNFRTKEGIRLKPYLIDFSTADK